jgi:hypothetical protein
MSLVILNPHICGGNGDDGVAEKGSGVSNSIRQCIEGLTFYCCT